MAEAIAEPAAARPVATGLNPWLPATPELDAARARWENLAQTIESRGTESFNASEQKFLKAWRQWEIDTNRKIEAGKQQWDDKFKTFLTSKQNWQDEIKAAAMEQSLEKMLGATGSALNERLKTLSANINIPVDVPEINVANLVQAAMADFERSKPSNERLFGEINKSITAFNVTLELGNATHFKGFNSSTLEGDFASNMETFSKKMAILNNVKMYESFKKLIEDFKESLRKNDTNVTAGLTTAATLANYRQDGGWYTKDMGWAFGGKYGFSAYQHADVDGLMNRGMREAGMTIMSGDEMVSFLEKGRDIDVKLFFEVQTMALEQAFKIVGGDKSKKGLYGEWVGEAPQYNNDGDETNQGSGELGGWAGGQMDNKKTYRGLNKEEKRLGLVQGVWTTAMNITASVVAAASGNIPMMMQIAAAQATATTGTSISQGRDAGGSIAVGLMDFGISVGGAMVGGDWTGAAIRGGAGFVRAGIGQNADGTLNLDFKGNWTKNGAGASAAFSGVMSTLGTGIGDKVGGKLGFAISAGMDAIGDGMRFNGDGSIGGFSTASAIGSLAASGVSYGFNNSTSTSGSHFDGPVVKQMLSSEMGKIAKSVTTTILGSAFNDARAFNTGLNSYQQVNGWSALGGLLGRQLKVGMDARSQQRQAQEGGEGGVAGNFVGGIMAQGTRRRRDWLDEIGDVTSDAGSILSDAAKDFGGAIYENALQPIGNTLSRIGNGFLAAGYMIGEMAVDGYNAIFGSSKPQALYHSGSAAEQFDAGGEPIYERADGKLFKYDKKKGKAVPYTPEDRGTWDKVKGYVKGKALKNWGYATNDVVAYYKGHAIERGYEWNDEGVNIIGIRFESQAKEARTVAAGGTRKDDFFLVIENNRAVGLYFGSTEPGQERWTNRKTGETSEELGGVAHLSPGRYPYAAEYNTKRGYYVLRSTTDLYVNRDQNADGWTNLQEKNEFFNANRTILFHLGGKEDFVKEPMYDKKGKVVGYQLAIKPEPVNQWSQGCQVITGSFSYDLIENEPIVYATEDINHIKKKGPIFAGAFEDFMSDVGERNKNVNYILMDSANSAGKFNKLFAQYRNQSIHAFLEQYRSEIQAKNPKIPVTIRNYEP